METGTKSFGDGIDENLAYATTFGNMAHKTNYQSLSGLKGFGNVDVREKVAQVYAEGMKAHNTQSGGAGTAGYAMIPVYVDPRVIDTTRKWTPFVELVSRVTNKGMYADYNKLTTKGGGFTATEDGSMSEKNNTYDRASTAIKFLYAVGRVTGPSVAAQPSYVLAGLGPSTGATGGFGDQGAPNAKQMEMLVAARAMQELQENLLINGNSSSSGIAGNPDGTEFDGIVTLMSTTNTVAKGTTPLALPDITKAVRYAFDDGGRPNLAICSSGVYEDLINLLSAKVGFLQATKQVFWGFETIVLHTMVGDIPVIPSMFLSNASGSKAIYFLDMSVIEMRVLQDMTYEELAKVNDSQKFMLKIYETFLIKNTPFCSSITGISG